MKTTYITSTIVLFLVIFFGVISKVNASENSQKKERSRMRIYYEKLPDNSKKLSIILTKGKGKSMAGIEDAEVILSTLRGEEEVPLATLFTDANGEVDLYIQADYVFPTDDDGYTAIIGVYNGNDSLKASDKDIKIKDLKMDVSFDIVDSLKLVMVSVYELDSVGDKKPIEGIDVKIGVDRLHSTLYLEEIESDDNGFVEMEFPNDIPGDGNGDITIVVNVEEHKYYGTITKTIESDWGLIVDYSEASNGRSLFGEEAPLWMTISIFVILLGAWFHFIFAGFQVYKMAKTGKKVNTK